MTALFAAVIFVVVDGGWTLVDAVLTFGRKGFKIDSAGIKCLRIGCDWGFNRFGADKFAIFVEDTILFEVDGRALVEVNELLCAMLTAVAKSRPPP